MTVENLVKIGIKKLGLEKTVEINEVEREIKTPTGSYAQATMQTVEEKHILTIKKDVKEDHVFEYKINHELCHAKLNEMGIQQIDSNNKQIPKENKQGVYKYKTVVLLVYEYYADLLCYNVFGIDEKIIYAHQTVLQLTDEVKKIFDNNEFTIHAYFVQLFLFKKLGYNIDVLKFYNVLLKIDPILLQWVEKIYALVSGLPDLSGDLDSNFIEKIIKIILSNYQSNPLKR